MFVGICCLMKNCNICVNCGGLFKVLINGFSVERNGNSFVGELSISRKKEVKFVFIVVMFKSV